MPAGNFCWPLDKTQHVLIHCCPSKMASPAEAVREFTIGAGQPAPDAPQLMNADEVHFISKMIVDETLELWATMFTAAEAKAAMTKIVADAEDLEKEMFSDDEQGYMNQVAAQADALVDIEYYMLNCAAKKGFNMSAIFGVVHGANMAKRNPETGKFEKRDDGKIIKPPGWQAPDVEGEIARQFSEGSWPYPYPAEAPAKVQIPLCLQQVGAWTDFKIVPDLPATPAKQRIAPTELSPVFDAGVLSPDASEQDWKFHASHIEPNTVLLTPSENVVRTLNVTPLHALKETSPGSGTTTSLIDTPAWMTPSDTEPSEEEAFLTWKNALAEEKKALEMEKHKRFGHASAFYRDREITQPSPATLVYDGDEEDLDFEDVDKSESPAALGINWVSNSLQELSPVIILTFILGSVRFHISESQHLTFAPSLTLLVAHPTSLHCRSPWA